jgi:chromate reductase, NAD(P)H dehydrogenase (quinone)
MSAIKLLLFSGSTRHGSLNTSLARAMAQMAANLGAQPMLVSLKDYPAAIYDTDWEKENGVPAPIRELGALMAECEAAFIACPEYNSGMTALLKNTIDWLSRLSPHPFTDTLFAIGGASPGVLGTARALPSLRATLVGLDAIVMPGQLAVGGAMSAFNEDGSFANERTEGFARAQFGRLIEVAGKLR